MPRQLIDLPRPRRPPTSPDSVAITRSIDTIGLTVLHPGGSGARLLGEPGTNEDGLRGWQLGDSWLTFFPAKGAVPAPDANPRNAEFAIEVAAPAEVDVLYAAFLAAGASPCMEPQDTWMYVPMRFAVVDDPFGLRVDVYCPLPGDVDRV